MLHHQHVIVRAEVAAPPTDTDRTQQWFKDLINAIGMRILTGPFVVYCDMPGNRGLTGIVAIETSSITLHAWDEDKPGVIQLDVFTCHNLDLNIVFDYLKVWKPLEIEYYFIDRNAPSEECCGSTTCSCAQSPSKLKIIKEGKIVYDI